jgi:hypothetical protein
MHAYFSAYVKDFATLIGRSPRQWEQDRRARILGKSWIKVSFDAPNIDIEGSVARARFRQHYRSDRLNESGIKTLTFVNVNRRWLIREESSAE